MKSFTKIALVFLAVAFLAANIAAVAEAETMYVGWKKNTTPRAGDLEARDLNTGALLAPDFDGWPADNIRPEGIAVSPLDGNVYAAVPYAYNESTTYYRVSSYDSSTGALANANYAVFDTYQDQGSTVQVTRGITFDSAGNLYVALGNTTTQSIAKYSVADGILNDLWGGGIQGAAYTGTGTLYTEVDIRGNTLYASVSQYYSADSGAVLAFNLNTGGTPTVLTQNAGTRVYGIALGPDGTLYSCSLTQVGKWSTSTTPFDTFEVLVDGLSSCGDVDYYNGNLYITMGDANGAYVVKYNLDTKELTSPFITYSANLGFNAGGYIAIVPEPGTMALLTAGLLGLLAYAWRKSK